MTVHLVALDPSVADRVANLGLPGVQWKQYDGIAELVTALRQETDTPYVILAAAASGDVDSHWNKPLRDESVAVRAIVVCDEVLEGDERRLLLSGTCRVMTWPLMPVGTELLFRDSSYLSVLFPGHLAGERSETHKLSLPSRKDQIPPIVRFLCERLDALGYPEEMVRSTIPLVIDEAVTNAMEHGNQWDASEMVEILADLHRDRFTLRVTDHGPGFERGDVASPLGEGRVDREGGRGLFLMESLMDEVCYEDDGRTIVLRKLRSVPVSV